MARSNIFRTVIEFGDCDPAQIVFYPNYFKWFDSSTRHFFDACGVPRWAELRKTTGIIGAPLVDASAKFLNPASYGDAIEVETSVAEWRRKSFVMRHVIRCRGTVLVEGSEIRIFAIEDPDDASKIRAITIPGNIQVLC